MLRAEEQILINKILGNKTKNWNFTISFLHEKFFSISRSWIELMALKHKRKVVKSAKSNFYSPWMLSPPSIWIYFSDNRRIVHSITLNRERNKERRLYRTWCRSYRAIEWKWKWERVISQLVVWFFFLLLLSFIHSFAFLSFLHNDLWEMKLHTLTLV